MYVSLSQRVTRNDRGFGFEFIRFNTLLNVFWHGKLIDVGGVSGAGQGGSSSSGRSRKFCFLLLNYWTMYSTRAAFTGKVSILSWHGNSTICNLLHAVCRISLTKEICRVVHGRWWRWRHHDGTVTTDLLMMMMMCISTKSQWWMITGQAAGWKDDPPLLRNSRHCKRFPYYHYLSIQIRMERAEYFISCSCAEQGWRATSHHQQHPSMSQ